MTGAAKGTILRLLADVGDACDVYQFDNIRNLVCSRVQCDEIWSFCHAKDYNIPKEKRNEGIGDMWTWTAIDADSNLVISWLLGKRTKAMGNTFITDLASRIDSRVQLSTHGFGIYGEPIEREFGGRVDYGQAIKIYGHANEDEPNKRYSPPIVVDTIRTSIFGKPDRRDISTSIVERQNLTMRMSMRRFTRLTNGFSKKAENLQRALALHFMYYNYCRKHITLKTTPAINAGLTDRIWSLHDLAKLPELLRGEAA